MARQKNDRPVKHPMTPRDRKELDKLYQYVKTVVMGYDQNQSLPQIIVLRLKGLLYGMTFLNNDEEDKANYSYDLVLNTFKYCSPEIQRVISTKHFKNEIAKFNYIAAIVENNLNDVYIRMKNISHAKKQENYSVEKSMNEEVYVHNFVAPERKKLSAELEAFF